MIIRVVAGLVRYKLTYVLRSLETRCVCQYVRVCIWLRAWFRVLFLRIAVVRACYVCNRAPFNGCLYGVRLTVYLCLRLSRCQPSVNMRAIWLA